MVGLAFFVSCGAVIGDEKGLKRQSMIVPSDFD